MLRFEPIALAPMKDWHARFRVPIVGFPKWSAAAPERLVFLSTEGGSGQAWTASPDGSGRRPLTDVVAGVEHIHAAPDGSGLIWWEDPSGDETGRWMLTRFETDGSGEPAPAPEPLLPDAPLAWAEGIGLAPGVVAAGFSDDAGYRILISRNGEPLRTLKIDTDEPIGIGREWENEWNGLSADGSLLCIRVATDGNIQRCKLQVYDTSTGTLVAEQHDARLHLRLCAWSPVAGDQRLVMLHEKDDLARPAVWNLATGERTDLKLDVPGETEVWGWWPDGSALLVQHDHLGRSTLHQCDPVDGRLADISDPTGVITGGGVRPDGNIWLRAERPEAPPTTTDTSGARIIPSTTDEEPSLRGNAFTHIVTNAGDGQPVHSMLATPDGQGPFPTILMIHGGPEWAHGYHWLPDVQAFVDEGFAVVMPNYRGSTGSGLRWREGFFGDVGFAESRDILAVLDAVIGQGVTDPTRVVVEGWSWGGYLSLLLIGTNPDSFRGAIGGIPVADCVACHEDCSPIQQAYDVAIFGGEPDDLPDMYAERSPITYVNDVQEPVLIIAGEADTRCPIRQVRTYEAAMREAGKDIEVTTYATGHHAAAVDEHIAHQELEIAFAKRVTETS